MGDAVPYFRDVTAIVIATPLTSLQCAPDVSLKINQMTGDSLMDELKHANQTGMSFPSSRSGRFSIRSMLKAYHTW